MQTCENCNNRFSWLGMNTSIWGLFGYKPLECKKCGAKHKITISGRLTVVALTVLPMILLTNYLIYYTSLDNIPAIVAIGLLAPFVGSIIAPYAVRYKMV